MKPEELKFKKFLLVAVNAFLPEVPSNNNPHGSAGLGSLLSIITEPFPGYKKILIPAYLALGIAAIALAGVYFTGKAIVGARDKKYTL